MSHWNISTLNFSSHLGLVSRALAHPETVASVSLWRGRFVTFNEGNGGVTGSMSLQNLAHRFTQATFQMGNDNSPLTPDQIDTCRQIVNLLNQHQQRADQLIAESHFSLGV